MLQSKKVSQLNRNTSPVYYNNSTLTSNGESYISAGLSKLIDQGTFVKPRVHKLNVFNLQRISAVYELVFRRAGEVPSLESPRDVAWRVARYDTA